MTDPIGAISDAVLREGCPVCKSKDGYSSWENQYSERALECKFCHSQFPLEACEILVNQWGLE